MNIKKVKALFPEALRSLLSFTQKDNYIIINPRQFLGSDNFSKIAEIVTSNNGDYISAGKESHFRIPVSKPATDKAAPSARAQPPGDLHFKIARLTVLLARTVQHGDKEWTKQSYSLEIEVGSDEKDVVEKAKAEGEQLVQSWLTEPVAPTAVIPEFNPEDLMKHEGWKGKKTGNGEYAKGSLTWGWDFRNNFSPDVIRVLEKTSPLVIGEYEFTLGEAFVSVKKKK